MIHFSKLIASLSVTTVVLISCGTKPQAVQPNNGARLAASHYAREVAKTAIKIWPDSFAHKAGSPARWSYDQGVILKGIEGLWNATGEGEWFSYIQKQMDHFVQDDGTIKGYHTGEYNIDHINNGKLVLLLYRVTGKEKYRKAAELLRNQLKNHPRTSEGGFWHKQVYPYQMWLDGLYMGQPFYAEYAAVMGEDTAFNDVTRQFILMERHSRDPKTGLLYHGWDERKQQRWADKNTGLSPNVWGRALGWYGMAMVDALDHFPQQHAGRDSIIAILNRFAAAVTSVQDKKTGLWYDVVSKPNEPKNYFEASGSAMLAYTLAKGVRKGYLPQNYIGHARRAFNGIIERFIRVENGQTNLHGTVSVSGLGGNPYRDGSFEYYMSEPVIVNDPKGMGAFIKAANEVALLDNQNIGAGKTVVLDNYFNNEWKNEPNGVATGWHYTWNDRSNGGFAMLGDVFEQNFANITMLQSAPTAQNLQKANVYLVVDPDTEKETAMPNKVTPTHADAVAQWVRNGGVLLLMGNDAGNADLEGLNILASKYGIVFNHDNYNLVQGNHFQQGAVMVPNGHELFPSAKKLYIKEVATIQASAPARSIITKEGKNIMAVASYGKGTVFAIGDPWLYNEYIDGRKLPADFDNYKAAVDLVKWALKKAGK